MAKSPKRSTPVTPNEWLETIPQPIVVTAIITLVSVVVITLSAVGAFQKLNNQVHDALLSVKGQEPLSNQVTIVEIDDATYDAFGWPIPRDIYGAIVHIAGGLGVKAIGFDVLFRDESPEPERDAIFATSVKANGRVLLPSAYDVPISSHQTRGLYAIESSRHPIEPLANASKAPAHLLVDSQVDGIARKVNLALKDPDSGDRVPSLALAMLEAGGDFQASWSNETSLVLQGPNNRRQKVPTDVHGRAIINYRYVPGQANSVVPENVVSFEVLYDTVVRFSEDAPGAKETLEGWFKDKYVLLGPSAQDVGDRSPLPTVHEAPMMYAHANALDNLLENRFLTQVDGLVIYGLIVLMSIFTSLLVLATPTGISAILTTLLALGAAASSHVLLGKLLIFDVAELGAALLGAFSITSLYRRLVVERQARLALEAFQRFVSPHVLDQLKRNPDLLNMQGHRRNMSILFSDIVGYTALSNALAEDAIVELLRRYLGPMLDTILEHDGTVDKVNGDGIMAFFGDPIHLENSSINAVACAQAMHERLNTLNEEWSNLGLPTLQIRVGIASGEVYCGNFGSDKYVEYTVIGPTVNLAARLEAKATVGTSMVCRRTYKAIRGHHPCRLVTQIRLKGFEKPQSAYEVLPVGIAEAPDSRRKHQRLSLTTPFRVRGPNNLFEATAINISEGGIYISTDYPLTLGETITINTFLEEDETLNLSMEGIIRHNRPDPSGVEGYGIEFIRLISDTPEVIEHAMELLLGELRSLEQISTIQTAEGVTKYGIEAQALTGEYPPVE